jgi:class 3 adenylate cyclase
MPLAINRGKTVTVADITWLYTVLHPLSLRILKESNCRSAAAVPVFLNHSDQKQDRETQKAWGILWLESQQSGEFTPNQEPGLRILSAAVESAIARVDYESRARGALTELVRADIADKLLRQVSVREEEQGYLIIADIRGSTKIANSAGAETWLRFIGSVRGVLEEVATKHGLRLQFIIWDAFYFTVQSGPQHHRAIPEFVTFAREVNAVLAAAFEIMFPDAAAANDGARARFCVEYGDITRDVSNGQWTITGAAMASVSKLEAACKELRGWFFFTEAVLSSANPSYEILKNINPGTDSRIVTAKVTAVDSSLSREIRQHLNDALSLLKPALGKKVA